MGLLNMKALVAGIVLCHYCLTSTVAVVFVADIQLAPGSSLAEGQEMVFANWRIQNRGGVMSLYQNDRLRMGSEFVTSNACTLTMQLDGNLVITDDTDSVVHYASDTGVPGSYLSLREGYLALLFPDGSEMLNFFQET